QGRSERHGRDGIEQSLLAAALHVRDEPFSHYLKVIVRDWVGRYKEKEQLERDLTRWIMGYVDGSPATSSEAAKCRRPLAGASIKVQENEENPGYYSAMLELRPHFQLEGMDIGLRLVSRLTKAD